MVSLEGTSGDSWIRQTSINVWLSALTSEMPIIHLLRRHNLFLRQSYSYTQKTDRSITSQFLTPLEQLKLAESLDTTSRTGCGATRSSFGRTRSGIPRPSLNCRPDLFQNATPRRLRKSPCGKGPRVVSAADAQWFLGLPDKVRKKHFSREEQVILAGRRRSARSDVSDRAFYSRGRKNNHSQGTASTLLATRSSVQPSAVDSEATVAVCSDMDDKMENAFRWLDDDDDLDLTLDDYHHHLTETAVATSSAGPPKPTFRRGISLNSIKVRCDSMSSIKLPISQVPSPLPSPSLPVSHQRTKPRPESAQLRWSRRPSVPTIDPGAKHYRDPEARLKLRVYLASPQRFDEVIEFGFPSLESRDDGITLRAKSAGNGGHGNNYNTTNTHSFLNDDGASFLEADHGDVDNASLPDLDAPETPSAATFKPTHRLTHSSRSNLGDSSFLARPYSKPRTPEQHARVVPGGREMTLRMTLTRPDLRDDETALYDWQDGLEKDDPLALEELHLGPEGAAGIVGPFGGSDGWGPTKDDGMVKKMWKKVSRRS